MIDSAVSGELKDERGWRSLEATLRPFVRRRVASDVDVDDVLQEVFLRIHRNVAALDDHQRFGAWVYQLTRRVIVDHHRASARHPSAPAKTLAATEAAATEDEDSVNQEMAAYAARVVSLLPSPYREALTLTELEGLTQQQAADMAGISLSGMKSRVQRGRQKLRTALEECCHIALDARQRVVSCEPRAGGVECDCCR